MSLEIGASAAIGQATATQLANTYLARDHKGGLAVVTDASPPYLAFADTTTLPTCWRKPDGTLISNDPALYLSGTQLILLDSESGGTGNLHPPAYYIAQNALAAGRLAALWYRAVLATTPASGSGLSVGGSANIVSVGGAGSTGTLEQYLPNMTGMWVKPSVVAADTITHSFNEFPVLTFDVYVIQTGTAFTFNAQFDSGPVTPVSVPAGTAGTPYKAVTLTNPAGATTGSVKLNNFSGQTVYAGGFGKTSVAISSTNLALVNFAIAGKTTAQYLAGVRNKEWMAALGVTDAIVNTGTNDVTGVVATDRAAVRTNWPALFNEMNTAGVPDSRILFIRPNQNAMDLSGIWEEVAAARPAMKFASIIRLYGPLTTFQANNWMSDTVHANDTFNKIWGDAEYLNNSLPNAYAAVDNGVNPRYYSRFAANTIVNLTSTVTVTGDFTTTVRFYWPAVNAAYLSGQNNAVYDHYVEILTTGVMTFRVGSFPITTAAGAIPAVAGWYEIVFKRIGTTGTLYLRQADNSLLQIATGTNTNMGKPMLIDRIGAHAGATSKSGFILESYTIDNAATPFKWVFDQTLDSDAIVATTGTAPATFASRTLTDSEVSRYGKKGGQLINTFDGARSLGQVPTWW